MYDALKAPTPTAKAVSQFLEDYDIGEVWGGKKDNLVKITSFFDICFHCNKLEFLIGTELDWPGEFFPFSYFDMHRQSSVLKQSLRKLYNSPQ